MIRQEYPQLGDPVGYSYIEKAHRSVSTTIIIHYFIGLYLLTYYLDFIIDTVHCSEEFIHSFIPSLKTQFKKMLYDLTM